MKPIVLYRSLSGFTKKYAEWIAEDLGADLCDCRERLVRPLSDYDLVVHCGSLHKGGINGVDVLKRALPSLAGKRVIVLAVGGSAAKEGIVEGLLAANFTEEERAAIRLFYLRGGFDLHKLNLRNRFLMALRIRQVRKKKAEDRDADERDLLAAYSDPADVTERAGIRPLVDYARA